MKTWRKRWANLDRPNFQSREEKTEPTFRKTTNQGTKQPNQPNYQPTIQGAQNQYDHRTNQQKRTKPTNINPLQTKRRPLYLKTQSVLRCKHFSSGL